MSATTTLAAQSAKQNAPQAPPAPRIRPYKDFLTPWLHRRFTSAAVVGLVASYAAAIIMSPFNIIWSWFPLGLVGIRTGLIFICMLMVFVVRIGNLHIASHRSRSLFTYVCRCMGTFGTYQIMFWYAGSAFIFSEVYIWSAPDSLKLSIVDGAKAYERQFLNERPIFLRSMFVLLGLWQAIYHVLHEFDRVDGPRFAPPGLVTARSDGLVEIRANMWGALQHSLWSVFVTTPTLPFVYMVILRRHIWHWTFALQSKIVDLPRHQKLSTFPPYIGYLLIRYLFWGFVLVLLWTICSTAFDVYITQPPFNKKNQPLSTDSKDPNGTLLAGLKAKKEFTRTAAFAELAVIAQQDQVRRKAILLDIERAGGSAWSQVVSVCLGQMQGINKRINDFRNPPTPSPLPPEQQPGSVYHLPRMAPPMRQENILSSQPPASKPSVTADVGAFARAHGNNLDTQNPISPRALKLASLAKDRLLSKDQQAALSQSGLANAIQHYAIEFLKLPYVGPFFQLTFAQRAVAVVVGQPELDASNIPTMLNAIEALPTFVVRTAEEDTLGRASRDVATIIRTYVATINTIEEFVDWLQPHWTDVKFKDKRAIEIEDILTALKSGLRAILDVYEDYKELDLTIRERRIAREKASIVQPDGDVFMDAGLPDARRRPIADTAERRRRPLQDTPL